MIDSRRATHGGTSPGWRSLRALLAIAAATFAPGSTATILDEHLALDCSQPSPLELRCSYRLREGGELQAALGHWQDQTLSATLGARYPQATDYTALLLLVDTSDPARAPALRAAVAHVSALVAAAPPHFRIGLASFDSDLRMLAPIASEHHALLISASQLRAKGRTTELYRSVGEALRVLANNDATRKVLWVLSDGLAEDYAYHHEDVIALARAHDIIINSIGYPRSVPQSVALQTLRRLSDDSGGEFLQATFPDFNLPADGLLRTLTLLDDGGRLVFDLTPLVAKGGAGASELELSLQFGERHLVASLPIELPASKVRTRAEAAPAPAASPAPLPATVLVNKGMNATQVWPWFSSLMAVSLAILGSIMVLYLRVKRGAQSVRAASAKPLAWLLLAEAPYTRHAIDRLPWRIGRGSSNDFTLADQSVSRLHAEVRGSEHGGVILHDLESLNGVFVNDTRIDSVQLRDGDSVDIGDVRMRYTLHDESYAAQEATIMVRTRTPT